LKELKMSNINKLGKKLSLVLTMVVLTLGILMSAANISFADITITQLSAYDLNEHYVTVPVTYPPNYEADGDTGAIRAGTVGVPILKAVLDVNNQTAPLSELTIVYTGTDPLDLLRGAIYDDSTKTLLSLGTKPSDTGREIKLYLPNDPTTGTFIIVLDISPDATVSNIVDAKVLEVNEVGPVANGDMTEVGIINTPNPGNPDPVGQPQTENFARLDLTPPTLYDNTVPPNPNICAGGI
jgi:hypothetical protein